MGRASTRDGGVSRATLLSLRHPLLQFLLLGAIAFRLVHGPRPFAAVALGDSRRPITVGAAQVARMREDYAQATGLVPDASDEAALVDRWIDEELLYREAQARGLDRNDRSVAHWLAEQARVLEDEAPGGAGAGASEADDASTREALYARALELGLDRKDLVVRRIVVQKMRLLASRDGESEVEDDELRTFHAAHASEFASPGRTTLRHVFFASRAGNPDARARAAALLEELRAGGATGDTAAERGDAFAVPSRLVAQSPRQIEKLFGGEFARRLEGLPPGTWSGPIASTTGWHLVLVEEREPAAVAPFESVRSRVLESWRERRRGERLAAFVAGLRARQPIEVESEAWRSRSGS